MKSRTSANVDSAILSPPSRGAWIEICDIQEPSGGCPESPPSRGAWIEIPDEVFALDRRKVAPLAGGVD